MASISLDVFLGKLPDESFTALLGSDEVTSGRFEPPLVNVGTGRDITISELATLIQRTVGHQGEIVFDTTQPDGTPRKLLDVSRLNGFGWAASTPLERGLRTAYAEFVATQV